MGRVKVRACEILEIPSKPGDTAGRAFDAFIITLIVLNVGAVIFETVGDNATRYHAWLAAFEIGSLAVFTAEYVLRMWSITANPRFQDPVTGRLRFAMTPIALVDLVAILPAFLLPVVDLRFARAIRLLRLLKLSRYSASMTIVTRVVRSRAQALGMAFFLLMMALLLSSSMMYYAEHEAQPEAFASIPHAMWWGIVTVSSIGYGDIVPVTLLGRLVGGVTAIIGIGVVALPVGILASGFMEELETRQRRPHATRCPHCGESIDGDAARLVNVDEPAASTARRPTLRE